jgi:hypothetical protein
MDNENFVCTFVIRQIWETHYHMGNRTFCISCGNQNRKSEPSAKRRQAVKTLETSAPNWLKFATTQGMHGCTANPLSLDRSFIPMTPPNSASPLA